ncbi:tail fiber domain-containing protein [Dyadobacter endophyticus]|uniref:tail fiber domain-containing protein n=1 Tax=Dyadobacter endophyticus TaxID=1749036 RepID=UPI003CF0121B
MENLSARASGQIEAVPITSNSKIRKAFSRKPRHILVTLLSVSLLLISQFTKAQAPQQFSFQGVARDATGKIVKDTPVSVRIKIHKDSPIGAVVFSETQIVTTNSSGVFDLVIGGLAGGLDDINWGSDNCFLQTEIDVNGGANFVNLGTTALKSVPYALVSRQLLNNIPIIQTGIIGSGPALPPLTAGANLIWYPQKAAFRAGSIDVLTYWDDSNTGLNSFAAGKNTIAAGEHSIALGNTSFTTKIGGIAIGTASTTSGNYGVAIGRQAAASGLNSVSIGYTTTTTGESSVAIGLGTIAKSLGAVSLGAFNNASDPGIFTEPTDRVFQIGNGSSDFGRSNALTILRNGNIGIGNNVLEPTYIMDLGGRQRIRHNGATAGIYFNNSQNVEDGFVGMKTDDEIGFYVNGAWRFWVNSVVSYSHGFVVNTSDRRLKTNITSFPYPSLSKLTQLTGYYYNWLDSKRDQSKQTGLIAQDVETYFPELVVTGPDGYKAVNYTGLIPHLIEAVKELDKRTDEITRLKKELAEVREINKRMTTLEAELKSLLTGNTSAIGKSHAK